MLLYLQGLCNMVLSLANSIQILWFVRDPKSFKLKTNPCLWTHLLNLASFIANNYKFNLWFLIVFYNDITLGAPSLSIAIDASTCWLSTLPIACTYCLSINFVVSSSLVGDLPLLWKIYFKTTFMHCSSHIFHRCVHMCLPPSFVFTNLVGRKNCDNIIARGYRSL